PARIPSATNDSSTTDIYTLSLHDALPISPSKSWSASTKLGRAYRYRLGGDTPRLWRNRSTDGRLVMGQLRSTKAAKARSPERSRSEEHTSELQSLAYLVCRLLLEKKNIHN